MTAQIAFFPPSFVVAVMVAAPADLAVTTPVLDTEATVVLLDDQVTDLSVASEGVTVAVKDTSSPSVKERLALSRVTPVTGITFALTVTVHDAVLLPSSVVTKIMVVPSVIASTRPDWETVAT